MTPENDMLLDSLSRKSDETHLLMQEVGAVGFYKPCVTSNSLQGVLRNENFQRAQS